MPNDGKYLEKVIVLLEKSYNPDAIVEHDIQMPVIGTEFTTQCDVVIRVGKQPRQIITICEVQDRSTQMTPNDLRGFIEKMREIGAQRLICISRNEFSESNKKRALSYGGSVLLMTIKDIDDLQILPVNFEPSYGEFQVINVQPDFLLSKEEITQNELDQLGINNHELITNKIFTYDRQNFYKFSELCYFQWDAFSLTNSFEGERNIEIKLNNVPQLYIKLNNLYYRFGLKAKYYYKWIFTQFETYALEYKADENNILGWYVEMKFVNSNGEHIIKTVLVKDGENNFHIQNIHFELP